MAKKCFLFVLGLLVTLYTVTNSVGAESDEDGAYLYIGELNDENDNGIAVQMPESCAGKNYCFDKGTEYPEDVIEELLKDIRNWKVGRTQSNIGGRYGEDKDCLDDYTEDPIYYIRDKQDEVRVVVQLKDKFEQTYTVRWCLNPGTIIESTHFLRNSLTLQNFNVTCVDTMANFEFFVLREVMDQETGDKSYKVEVTTANGGIPACCRCRYDPKI